MRKVAAERRRFGYRRIHVMLQRQGIDMNLKKLRRLYREEKLQVRRRGGRKRAVGTRRPLTVPDRPNGTLEPGLRERRLHRWPALPDLGRCRRLQPRMSGSHLRWREVGAQVIAHLG